MKDNPEHFEEMRDLFTELDEVLEEVVIEYELPETLRENLKKWYHFAAEKSEYYDDKLKGKDID